MLQGFDGDAVASGFISYDNFCTLVVDFEIHPKHVAKSDLAFCFARSKHGVAKPTTDLDLSKPLHYPEFLECMVRVGLLGFFTASPPPQQPLVEFKHSEYNPQAKHYWLQHPNGLPSSPSVNLFATGR